MYDKLYKQMAIFIFVLLMGLSSCLQGITGFGYALIAAPLALIFLDKETMVVSMLIISVVLNASLISGNSMPVKPQILKQLLLGGMLGIPAGIYILNVIPFIYLKLFVGIMAIVFSVLIYMQKIELPEGKLVTIIVGFFVGMLQSSISMSGPPAVLYLVSQKVEKLEMKKILAILFFVISTATMVIFFLASKLTLTRSLYGIISIPAVIIGGQIGHKLANKLPVKTFRVISLWLMIATGAYTIWSVL